MAVLTKRELLTIQRLYKNKVPAKIIADSYDLDPSYVYKILKKSEDELTPRVHDRGRKSMFNEDIDKKIKNLLNNTPQLTVGEIIMLLNLNVSETAMLNHLHALGYTYKRVSGFASERKRPRHR